MLQVLVNDSTVEVSLNGNTAKVNGKDHVLDVLSIQEGKFIHIIHNEHSYQFEVVSFDKDSKSYQIAFNGQLYTIGIKDRFDQLLQSMGLDKINQHQVNEVKAPMPGLVLSIKVSEGQDVKKGDPILILEAMKMENVIKSPADGVVKQIMVNEKQAVDKNQTLIQFN